MKFLPKKIAGFAAVLGLLFVCSAQVAQAGCPVPPHGLCIDINKPNPEPMPIALVDLIGEDGNSSQLGRDITRVAAADLERSGLFRPIDSSAFIEKITSGNAIPRFADWRQIKADALVVGSISSDGDKIRVDFRLWDPTGETQMTGKEFNSTQTNWRRVGHLMADEIYKKITGEDGYFDSRIVYVAESGPARHRVKRLAIMDQDGENHKFLTDGSTLVLTPRFSPNSQEILYMSYARREPRVFLRDLQSGEEESLGHFEGMSFAPRFSPDGNHVAMSIARNGSTQLYTMDLRTRAIHQMTNTPGIINTSPSYSPDGTKIVFNSDRGGSPQLYVMDAGGGNVQRVSFGQGSYGTPVWSPRGDLIAFTKPSTHGNFIIGVMHPDGSGERELAQDYLVEGPTWSPNGRVIAYFSQERGGRTRIFTIDLTGANKREVVTPLDASDPAWSPRLPM